MTPPQQLQEPFIRMRNVRKVYRSRGQEFLAVSDVTMDVREGESSKASQANSGLVMAIFMKASDAEERSVGNTITTQ